MITNNEKEFLKKQDISGITLNYFLRKERERKRKQKGEYLNRFFRKYVKKSETFYINNQKFITTKLMPVDYSLKNIKK